MGKTKKKLTREEKLAKDRIRKKLKYEEIKNNPIAYAMQQEKEKLRYLKKKERKKVLSISEMTERGKREQRRRWRKNSKKYSDKMKEQKNIQRILLQNTPPESENEIDHIANFRHEEAVVDPLAEVELQPAEVVESRENNSSPTPNILAQCSALGSQAESKYSCDSSFTIQAKLRRKIRYRDLKLNTLNKKLAETEKEKEKLEKQVKKMKKEDNNNAVQFDTLEKKVEDIVKDIKKDKIEEVKKKLLFTETVARRFTSKYQTLPKKDKRPFAEDLFKDKSKLKKYGVFTKLPFNLKQKAAENSLGIKGKVIKRQVHSFFEEDVNSQVAAGKCEYIKRGGEKKQKRYLSDNLKNLHSKYCNQYGYIGYSTFCRTRPFWTVFPNDKRDTCQCKIHANVELLVKALKRANIIREGSTTEVLGSLCCDVHDQKCLERTCQNCCGKVLEYKEFDDSIKVKYYQWIAEKKSYIPSGKDSTEKTKNITTKKRLEDQPRLLINKLDTLLVSFFKHARNILVQYRTVKDLKENLTQKEVICHIDFSENYALKYHEEVQSHHFVREQIALHTGVLYYIDNDEKLSTKSFCTASECLNHDANAIWAHLVPILNIATNLVRNLRSIHFVSDSPSSQYRNRFIFHMISQLQKHIPSLEEVTWNYFEVGHGKGAPDGIGAVVKRTADNFVKFGNDVANIEDFVTTIKEKVNVHVEIIPTEEVRKNKFPEHVPAFKGTTKVHQVIWSLDLPHSVAFRALSCFICRNSYLPCNHHKHLGVLNVAIPIATTARVSITTRATEQTANIDLMTENVDDEMNDQEVARNERYVDISEENRFPGENFSCNIGTESPLQLDSPTIFNNVGNMLLNEFDGTMFVEEELIKSVSGDTHDLKNQPKVQILSNIPVSYQNITESRRVLKNVSNIIVNEAKQIILNKSKSMHQKEFEHFLELSSSHGLSVSNAAQDTINVDSVDLKYNIDMWVIVEYKVKNGSRYFVGKITETIVPTKEYKILFVRKALCKNLKFGWPTIADEDTVSENQILQCLKDPKENRRGQFTFEDLPKFKF